MFTEEHLQLSTSFRVRTFGLKIQEMLDDPDYDDVSFESKVVEALEVEDVGRTNVNGQFELPRGGQVNYPLVARSSAHWLVVLAAGSGVRGWVGCRCRLRLGSTGWILQRSGRCGRGAVTGPRWR